MVDKKNVFFGIILVVIILFTLGGYWYFSSQQQNNGGVVTGSGNDFVFSNANNTFDDIFNQVQGSQQDVLGILGCEYLSVTQQVQFCNAANTRLKNNNNGAFITIQASNNNQNIAVMSKERNNSNKLRFGELNKGERIYSLNAQMDGKEKSFFLVEGENGTDDLRGFFDAPFTRSILDRFVFQMDQTNKDLGHVRIIVTPNNRCFTEFCNVYRNSKRYLIPSNETGKFTTTADSNNLNTLWMFET